MAITVDLDGKIGQLQSFMLSYFAGQLEQVASFAPFHMVETNPFQIMQLTNNSIAYEDAAKRSKDTDMIPRLDMSLSDAAKTLIPWALKTEIGDIQKSKSVGNPMSLRGLAANKLSEQAAYKVNKDVATLLDASTFAAAQAAAAGTVWSNAAATPKANVNALKAKLYAGTNIMANDPRVHLVLDYTSAVECQATTEYKTWFNAGGAAGYFTDVERLQAFFEIPNVIIIGISDNASTALYSAIVDLMVVDRTGLNGQIFIPTQQMIPDNQSGLLVAFQNQTSFEWAQVFNVTLPNGLTQDFTDSMIKVWDAVNENDNEVIGAKMFYKPYVHKTEALTGLTGV